MTVVEAVASISCMLGFEPTLTQHEVTKKLWFNWSCIDFVVDENSNVEVDVWFINVASTNGRRAYSNDCKRLYAVVGYCHVHGIAVRAHTKEKP